MWYYCFARLKSVAALFSLVLLTHKSYAAV